MSGLNVGNTQPLNPLNPGAALSPRVQNLNAAVAARDEEGNAMARHSLTLRAGIETHLVGNGSTADAASKASYDLLEWKLGHRNPSENLAAQWNSLPPAVQGLFEPLKGTAERTQKIDQNIMAAQAQLSGAERSALRSEGLKAASQRLAAQGKAVGDRLPSSEVAAQYAQVNRWIANGLIPVGSTKASDFVRGSVQQNGKAITSLVDVDSGKVFNAKDPALSGKVINKGKAQPLDPATLTEGLGNTLTRMGI